MTSLITKLHQLKNLVREQQVFLIFAVILSCIYLWSWQLQNQLLFNSDVSQFLHGASVFLAGGTYTKNFFELNPPMIVYLSMPVVILAGLTKLPLIIALRVYIYFLSTLSLILCSSLLRTIFAPSDKAMRLIILLSIALALLILPMGEFAQREHLLVIFSLPYLFLVTSRLQGDHAHALPLSLTIGVLAGLGFAIKPYFLLTFLFIELYYCYCQRSFWGWLRAETLAILLVLSVYTLSIIFLHREYLSDILPVVTQFYYQRYGKSWAELLTSDQAFFSWLTFLFYFIRQKVTRYKQLSNILALAALGYFLSFIMQRTLWYYHVLPAFSINLLLLTFLYGILVAEKNIRTKEYLYLLLFSLVAAAYFIFKMSYLEVSLHFPHFIFAYFLLFLSMSAALLYYSNKQYPLAKAIFYTGLIFIFNFTLFRYLQFSALKSHLILITGSMFFLLFALFMPYRTAAKKAQLSLLFLIGILLYLYPTYKATFAYDQSRYYGKLYNNLIKVLAPFTGKTLVFISPVADFAFPEVDYTQQKYGSRFSSMIWLPRYAAEKQLAKNQAYYLSALAEDLDKSKPDLVLIDTRNQSKYRYFGIVPQDFLKILSSNEAFKTQWKNYYYAKTEDYPPLYKFDLYYRR